MAKRGTVGGFFLAGRSMHWILIGKIISKVTKSL